jgi:uncharacterized protein YkwD
VPAGEHPEARPGPIRLKSLAAGAETNRSNTPSENGKPAATQGRKARGPQRVAQLPNWEVVVAVFKKTAALALAAIVFGALAPSTPPSAVFTLDDAVAAGSSDNQCWHYRKKERRFTRKMNAARDDSNKQKLRLDPEISKVARKHTREMIKAATLHHTPSTTLARRVTKWTVLGENVGVGGSVSSLHDAFMNSPSHKSNILYSTFKHIGVGTKKDANGRLWVTVIFEASNDPGTTLSMPRC